MQLKHWQHSHRKLTANAIRSSKVTVSMKRTAGVCVCVWRRMLCCGLMPIITQNIWDLHYIKLLWHRDFLISWRRTQRLFVSSWCLCVRARESVRLPSASDPMAGRSFFIAHWELEGLMENMSCDLHASCKTFPVDFTSYSTRRKRANSHVCADASTSSWPLSGMLPFQGQHEIRINCLLS